MSGEKFTYTETLALIRSEMEDVKDRIKSMDRKIDSIDDRERMAQRELSRIIGKLEGLEKGKENARRDLEKEEENTRRGEEKGEENARQVTTSRRWNTTTVITVIFGIVSLILAILGWTR